MLLNPSMDCIWILHCPDTGDYWLYVVAMRLDDGNLLIVATDHSPYTAITDYTKRWGIETLFG